MSGNNTDLNKLYAELGMENPDELEKSEGLYSIESNFDEIDQSLFDENGNVRVGGCNSCSLEGRINCCKRHPETNDFVTKKFGVGNRDVCPNLGLDGLCQIYDSRPPACESFFCEKAQGELELNTNYDTIPVNVSALYEFN